MALTTDNIKYASSTTMICTLGGLASSSTSARQSTAVDNTTNLYDDAMVFVAVKTTSSAVANDKACYVYFYGEENGTGGFSISSAESATAGTDGALTLDSPTNLRGPVILACPVSSGTYRTVIGSVASLFGGILPRRWGIVVNNFTGQVLDSTESAHTKSYTGITYTNQ